ncbi:MAG: DUF5681 domain-containing protein [Gammaproteobacteria bacterium]
MTFIKGTSGNTAGRPKGIPNKRSQLAKLLDSHADELISKLVELAKAGDVNALKFCVERLIPKAEHVPIDIELCEQIDLTNLPETKSKILAAALAGKMSLADAERFVLLMDKQVEKTPPPLAVPVIPMDPVEAANVYMRWMRES